MKHTLLTGFLVLFSTGTLMAQEQEKSLYIKGNAAFAPLGILNVAVEKQLTQKITLQGDVLISPWKSFAGHELQYYSVSVEGRYYFNEAFKHWYIGANIAGAAFTTQKWNYWNDRTFVTDSGEVFTNSNIYQKGYSIIFGVTGGYQFKVSDRWNIDLYASIGSSQDFYKGYERGTGQRYDSAQKFNKSGEIMPYRGGVMISYKLK
ncbi:hypothetical protein IW15_07100 [Chryseobacterium soli]|uniref:DUF3575 domain-containing protein n=2 Tax=Chryseobacterium soli TaxID=445961 RepID=A0A086AA33_9FLAO|nr:hypothetical protein IW15_07100 [Chryseobacterium soli]